jgi:hypothetical protein
MFRTILTAILCTLVKKKIKFFLKYKEIQMGSVAKSYMTNGLLIYVAKKRETLECSKKEGNFRM